MAHAYGNHNATLSKGAPSLLWSGLCLESLIGSGLARNPRVGCDDRGGAAAGVSPARRGAAQEGEEVVRATPTFWPLVRHGGGQRGTGVRTPLVPLAGGRSHHRDPCGKAAMLKTCPGQPIPWASLLQGLQILSRPLGQVTRPVVHQDTPAFEQVRAGIGRLHPVAGHLRQGRFDHLSEMIRRSTNPVKAFGLHLFRVERLIVLP